MEFKETVKLLLAQFTDLSQDSNYMIRFSSTMVLCKMCDIAEEDARLLLT